ncbi:MAG: HAMP domain-containing sensor histidine kinase [Bacillota bacterium]|nr:HAMP domain-containing sensor histidine kinase [Bacillota bacterium]
MWQHQEAVARTILEIKEKTDLPLEQIISIARLSAFAVKAIDDPAELNLPEEEQRALAAGEIVYLADRFREATIYLRIDDKYLQIGLLPRSSVFTLTASRVLFAILSFVIIGAFLISVFARRVVNSVLELTRATQEVAKGNFDIQIENHRDDEIGQLTKNFNKMIRELKNIEYLRKDFITNVSHEFKTPLASIQGFAKLLMSESLPDEERKEYAAIILEEASRLTNLSSNILKITKLENQEIVEKRTLFPLDEQIRKSILLLEPAWSKKNIEFDLDLEKSQFSGDEELLQQVWINLLDNAIKFSNESGIISVRLRQNKKNVTVEIADNGIGMNEETKKRLFEKFYQGDKSRGGRGLGLSLVKRILDLYGGKISVESKLHAGTTFIISLTR